MHAQQHTQPVLLSQHSAQHSTAQQSHVTYMSQKIQDATCQDPMLTSHLDDLLIQSSRLHRISPHPFPPPLTIMPATRCCLAALLLAASASAIPESPQASLTLANWIKGRGTHNPHVYTWSEQNDPVMGGQSSGNYSVIEDEENSHALFQGTVRNVSFLHAPGFCRMSTVFPMGHLVDASDYLKEEGALELIVRNGQHTLPGAEYPGFKVAISSTKAARHHGGHELFGMYKANFEFGMVGPAPGLRGWDRVVIPFRKFSSDWSDGTGECATKDPDGYQHKCCDTGKEAVCPSEAGLSHINGLSVWAEGVEGDFELQIYSLSAVTLKRGQH
jgi:hypothetical protein